MERHGIKFLVDVFCGQLKQRVVIIITNYQTNIKLTKNLLFLKLIGTDLKMDLEAILMGRQFNTS